LDTNPERSNTLDEVPLNPAAVPADPGSGPGCPNATLAYVPLSEPSLDNTALVAVVAPTASPNRQYERGPRFATVDGCNDVDVYVYLVHEVADVGGHTDTSWSLK
jgi:hypothetical protein